MLTLPYLYICPSCTLQVLVTSRSSPWPGCNTPFTHAARMSEGPKKSCIAIIDAVARTRVKRLEAIRRIIFLLHFEPE